MHVGEKACDFTLQDQNGNMVSLSDFAGKKVVLYFYPKDNTPGCTRQACAFAQNYEEFEAKQERSAARARANGSNNDRKTKEVKTSQRSRKS